jgi:hypothetical protein
VGPLWPPLYSFYLGRVSGMLRANTIDILELETLPWKTPFNLNPQTNLNL